MNAITLLTDDHKALKKLLVRLPKTERAARRRLFGEVKKELTVHEAIEEEIFYPALKEHPRAREIVNEAFVEHDVVDRLMGEMEKLPVDDEMWEARCTVMTENIEHHIEEEEREMFAKARQVFDESELAALGERMDARKQEALRARA